MSRLPILALLAGLALTAVLLFVYCLIGSYPIELSDMFRQLIGRRPHDPLSLYVILMLRLPRAVAGCLVGMALGLAGGITQAVLQNPIAEPGTIGINAGASFAAVWLVVWWKTMPPDFLPLASFGGACLATSLVVALASGPRFGALTPERLVISGILVSLVFSAGILVAITFGDLFAIRGALRWMLGSVSDVTWRSVAPLACIMAIALPLTLLASRVLQVHSLRDRSARILGARVVRERIRFLILTAALSGGAVATAGPIAFAGLLAPNVARSLHGTVDKWQLCLSGLAGGVLVLASDMLGRLFFHTVDVPCGLLTAIAGAPCFLFLLGKRNREWRR